MAYTRTRPGLSLQGLHYVLWQRRLAGDVIRLNQQELGADLGLDPPSTSRLVRRMIDEGRLRRVSWQVYEVAHPCAWTS